MQQVFAHRFVRAVVAVVVKSSLVNDTGFDRAVFICISLDNSE